MLLQVETKYVWKVFKPTQSNERVHEMLRLSWVRLRSEQAFERRNGSLTKRRQLGGALRSPRPEVCEPIGRLLNEAVDKSGFDGIEKLRVVVRGQRNAGLVRAQVRGAARNDAHK